VFVAGGGLFSEQIAQPGFVADWRGRLGDRAFEVRIGSSSGTVWQRPPGVKDVRPYEVQWESDGRRFQVIAATDGSAAVVDMARSVACVDE
jgi:hypothetical protein